MHSFYDLVHSFLGRCWFNSQDWRFFREIFVFFASYSVIIFVISTLGLYDITVLEQRKRLIDTFVNAIFVYNDRLLFTFNYKRDAKTVLFSDLKSSDITKGVRPGIGNRKIPEFLLYLLTFSALFGADFLFSTLL